MRYNSRSIDSIASVTRMKQCEIRDDWAAEFPYSTIMQANWSFFLAAWVRAAKT
jgi:hypothetical protein